MFVIYINSHFTPYWSLTAIPNNTPGEFSAVSVNVQTNNAPGVYYWYVEHLATADADFEFNPPIISARSTFTITSSGQGSNSSVIILPPFRADGITEGPELFRVHVSETNTGDSVAHTDITIQDTSPAAYYVDAGLDQVLLGGINVAALNGYYSGDINTVTVTWMQFSGDTVIIGNVTALQTTITLPPGASGSITMRLYVNYGLPGQLYDEVNYFVNPLDNMSITAGSRLSSGPDSLEYTVNPRIEA